MRRWLHWVLILVTIAVGAVISDRYLLPPQKAREKSYQRELAVYSQRFKTGQTRKEVEDDLYMRKTRFTQASFADWILVGNDEHPWFCSEVNVYASLEFSVADTHPPYLLRGSDVLKGVDLVRMGGGCV